MNPNPDTGPPPDDRGAPGTEPLRLLVCINRRLGPAKPSCDGASLAAALEAEVRARGLAIPVERFICFGACHEGPNVRLAPGGRFFHRVRLEDVPAIVEAARVAGRLLQNPS